MAISSIGRVVQELVEAHGGRLEVDSGPGSRTTVSVFLPAAVEPGIAEGALARDGSPSGDLHPSYRDRGPIRSEPRE